jgi:hypothetical protein
MEVFGLCKQDTIGKGPNISRQDSPDENERLQTCFRKQSTVPLLKGTVIICTLHNMSNGFQFSICQSYRKVVFVLCHPLPPKGQKC